MILCHRTRHGSPLATRAGPPSPSPAIPAPAADRAAKEALAACHLERYTGPWLPCDLDPNCWPKTTPTTLREKECDQLLWMNFGGSQDPGAGPPCVLLRSAAVTDAVVEANDKAGAGALTIPEIARAAADYRAALVEHSSAQKDLADARAQGDTFRIVADRDRIKRALLLQRDAEERHGRACVP